MQNIILMLLIIFSCASTQSVAPEKRSRIVYKPYENVYSAVLNYVQEIGCPITFTDKESGIINTDYFTSESGIFSGASRFKINANLAKIDDNKTRIILIIISEEKQTLGGWQSANMSNRAAEDIYSIFFDGINNRLEK